MTLSPSTQRPRGRVNFVDLAILGLVIASIYALVAVAREWAGPLQPGLQIHLEARFLPWYMLLSLTRGVGAYGLSFMFTLVVGYAAARHNFAERILLPALDIGQSIPVLGFLPGLVLVLVHLFPSRNLGLEMASVLMIFTGQVWNMTFSFYGSLKSVPQDLQAVARLSRLTWSQSFFQLDLSFAVTGLVWNSMISMAGGWFFLTVSEAFVLGKQDFRLPGLGSYMSVAIERGDWRAQAMGVIAMMLMILFLDRLVWRPIVAWSQKFSTEEREGTEAAGLPIGLRLRRSVLLRNFWKLGPAVWAGCVRFLKRLPVPTRTPGPVKTVLRFIPRVLFIAALLGTVAGVIEYALFVSELKAADWRTLLRSTLLTFLRVVMAVGLASFWTIPIGVMIGRHPKWARHLQPIIQMAASFPAPMIFPLVVSLILVVGGNLGIGSVILLMLGTQWYVLFNVIAGINKIPPELWELARLNRFSLPIRWRKLILPGLFPYLVTGWITAMGGAWNASIVAEYVQHQGRLLTTAGLGALISQATEQGEFHLLAAAVAMMALVVVGLNRLLWHPLGRLAQARFAFEG